MLGCPNLTAAEKCLQAPRGEPAAGISFDGSRRLSVDTWTNPCGHIDFYSEVRVEAQT